jgi:urease accessory protein
VSTKPPPTGTTRLAGHLELVAGADARGRTFVRRQSFQAPVHLGKGHEDAGALVLNVVNPTAGLLEGDRLRVNVRVEGGARLLLTTPSASRVHTMRGGCAEVTQSFTVAAGGSLEWWPEMLIPQRGARYHQQTQIDLAPDAELIFQETLAPGRVAYGEAFLYDEVRWKMDLRRDGRLLARERFRITPANGALTALQQRFPAAYYVSIFLVSPFFIEQTAKELLTLESDHANLWSGVSMVAPGLFIVRMIAADSLVLRRSLRRCRMTIYHILGRQAPDLRRAGEAAPEALVPR